MKLGDWVSKEHILNCTNRMSNNRMNMLDSIPFDRYPIAKEWKNKFELLRLFTSINSHTSVRTWYVTKRERNQNSMLQNRR